MQSRSIQVVTFLSVLALFVQGQTTPCPHDGFDGRDYTTEWRAPDVLDPASEVSSLPYSSEETVNFEDSSQAPYYLGPLPVNMGSASSYAILASAAITSSGTSVVNGDLGIYPGTSVTGFPPAVLNGNKHDADTAAQQAMIDLVAASTDAASRSYNQVLTKDVGGQTLHPGVYKSDSSLTVTGILKLDCQRQVLNPVWIFQIGSSFDVATSSKVQFINCLPNSNPQVWYNVGSSATYQTTSEVPGVTMALASITGVTSAHTGPLLARTAAVTIDTNNVNKGAGPFATSSTTV